MHTHNTHRSGNRSSWNGNVFIENYRIYLTELKSVLLKSSEGVLILSFFLSLFQNPDQSDIKIKTEQCVLHVASSTVSLDRVSPRGSVLFFMLLTFPQVCDNGGCGGLVCRRDLNNGVL